MKSLEVDRLIEKIGHEHEYLETVNDTIIDYWQEITKNSVLEENAQLVTLHEVSRLDQRLNVLMNMNSMHLKNIQQLTREIQDKLRE